MPQVILQSLLDASREPIIATDPTLRIIATNEAAVRAFSRANMELRDRRLSEVIRDMRLHTSVQQALLEGVSSDIKIDFTAAELRHYDVHVSPIQLEGRQCSVSVFYDVTQIERLERVRQEFLSNISHELRTPLTSIMAFVETLEDGAIDDPESNRKFLGVIRRNAERMHTLISAILELSQIESGKVYIDKQSIRVSKVVDDIFQDLARNADERSIGLINDVPADARVEADVSRLEQMLTNLIDNAIKFNRDAGSVTVEYSRRPGMDLISVTDTGEGILAAHLPRVFERFYRADRSRSRDIGGTGLGLAIVKHLARLHGGDVSVSSELSRGTRFVIELPTGPDQPSS